MNAQILNASKKNQSIVSALFLDYDGTLSPLNVSRAESKVHAKTSALLNHISQKIPIAIVTSKDARFVVPRTSFAKAWSTVCGLETKIGDEFFETPISQQKLENLSEGLEYAKSQITSFGADIEEKKNSRGETIGFCVDWCRSKSRKTAKCKAELLALQLKFWFLNVSYFEGDCFCDVYPEPVDKGNAVKELQRALGLKSGILFMGDSKMDNSAFLAADISVGVVHKNSSERLLSDYFVKFEQVPIFLKLLLDNHLMFNSSYSCLTHYPGVGFNE